MADGESILRMLMILNVNVFVCVELYSGCVSGAGGFVSGSVGSAPQDRGGAAGAL